MMLKESKTIEYIILLDLVLWFHYVEIYINELPLNRTRGMTRSVRY